MLIAIVVSLILLPGLFKGDLYKERLEGLGFECDERMFADSFKESVDNDAVRTDEEKEWDKALQNSSIADHKFLACEHGEGYEIEVWAVADWEFFADLTLDLFCDYAEENDFSEERIEEELLSFEENFSDPFLEASVVVGSYIYLGNSKSAKDKFIDLLDEQGIEYKSHKLPKEPSCEN